ncbi:MAG: nucleotidyltransferase family protein [Burkholderiales bacterium]|nr:nucleotidyltransferase family protein [Burkholderiales bacterium]
MRRGSARLVAALRQPQQASGLPVPDWSRLVRQARDANLLGALAVALEAAGVKAPPQAARHLDGASQLGQRQRLSVRWEAHCVQEALAPLATPILLLKGAAYVLAYPEIAQGRLFGDIDILVAADRIGPVESQLMLCGWTTAKIDPYDQRYYREWMHEIPPMVNLRRGTVLDVHHTILPLTARNKPDAKAILARSVPLEGFPTLRVPCPEDLLIHSITHLMHEGELHNGLRDLYDIDRMARSFSRRPGFWASAVAAATANDLALPVAHGLGLARRVFGSPVPDEAIAELWPAGTRLGAKRRLQAVYAKAFEAPGARGGDALAHAALGFIYLRGHWLRMPLPSLVAHLGRKAWMGLTTRPGE